MSPRSDRTAPERTTVDWIAVDWGTSNLRAWAMDAGGRVLARAVSDRGMGGLARDGYEPALLALVAPWLIAGRVTDVLACGMVGSRQGWIEAPYATVPCPPRGARPLARPSVRDPRICVHVLHGLRQNAPFDVMRGEETQIAGLIAREPDFDGVACLPGTHSKWVRVSAGEVTHFTSFMTGELFALISKGSVLRHSVAGEGWSDADFAEAAADTLGRPECLGARLFGIRAEALLASLPPASARARLSGLLIGAELAGSRAYWEGQRVVLIGAPVLAGAYSAALALSGVAAQALDPTEMTLAGLSAARATLSQQKAAP